MRIAIITVAGISSRFNEGIPEENKKLKAVFYENDTKNTLLYHLLKKCSYADKIVLVGGYKFESLKDYWLSLESEYKDKTTLVYNEHYEDFASGYSLYVGIKEALKEPVEDILFVEGDLDMDDESFCKVIDADKNILTYSYEPIYADKSVVLYRNKDNKYRYAFSRNHGFLQIDEPFSMMLHSGQLWRFTDAERLKISNDKFYEENRGGTNLRIIQNYIDISDDDDIKLIGLSRWTNCNTRLDYHKILSYWKAEK